MRPTRYPGACDDLFTLYSFLAPPGFRTACVGRRAYADAMARVGAMNAVNTAWQPFVAGPDNKSGCPRCSGGPQYAAGDFICVRKATTAAASASASSGGGSSGGGSGDGKGKGSNKD